MIIYIYIYISVSANVISLKKTKFIKMINICVCACVNVILLKKTKFIKIIKNDIYLLMILFKIDSAVHLIGCLNNQSDVQLSGL